VRWWLLLLLVVGIALSMPDVRAEPVAVVRMLLPSADEASPGWTASGCVSQYDCVNDNPPHDVDASYLTANPTTPGTLLSSFQVENLPNDVLSVESVTLYMWVRLEAPGSDGSSAYLTLEDGTACVGIVEIPPGTSYTNTTLILPVDCATNTWTSDAVNGLRLTVACVDDGNPPAEQNCRTTAAGIVVAYTTTGGTFTETEWDLRIGFTVFALLLIVGVFGRQPVFVLLAGIVGVFLAFAAFLATGQEWALVLFIALGPLLMLVGAVEIMTGDGD